MVQPCLSHCNFCTRCCYPQFSAFLPVPIFLFTPCCSSLCLDGCGEHSVPVSCDFREILLDVQKQRVWGFCSLSFFWSACIPQHAALYTGFAPQETGRNIVLVSRHFAMSQALCAAHLKFSSEENEEMRRTDCATQQWVLVIFHLKYEFQYNLIIIFLFSPISSRFHMNITAPFNSCLLRQLWFGGRVRNSVIFSCVKPQWRRNCSSSASTLFPGLSSRYFLKKLLLEEPDGYLLIHSWYVS